MILLFATGWRAGGRTVSVTTITRNCVHRSHQTGSVGVGSDHLQLIKFWRSCAPGKGSAAGRKFLAPCYYSQHAVFASLRALFSFRKCDGLGLGLGLEDLASAFWPRLTSQCTRSCRSVYMLHLSLCVLLLLLLLLNISCLVCLLFIVYITGVV